MILGGKTKSHKNNSIKAYLIDIYVSNKLEDFDYSLHELEDILWPNKLKQLIQSSKIVSRDYETPDFVEIPPVVNLSNK